MNYDVIASFDEGFVHVSGYLIAAYKYEPSEELVQRAIERLKEVRPKARNIVASVVPHVFPIP